MLVDLNSLNSDLAHLHQFNYPPVPSPKDSKKPSLKVKIHRSLGLSVAFRV